MQFSKRNIWTLAAMVLFVTVAMVGDAAAVDGTSLMTQASKKVSNVCEAVRTIIVGLAILAAANAVVQYAAGSKAGTGVTDTFGV